MPLDGHCLCGAVTYTSSSDALLAANCHCTECQRSTSSAFSTVVGVPRDALTIEGDALKTYVTVGTDSGQACKRLFCGECGSPIASLPDALPELALIKAGTLNDTSGVQPQLDCWVDSAQPWVNISETGRAVFARGPAQA